MTGNIKIDMTNKRTYFFISNYLGGYLRMKNKFLIVPLLAIIFLFSWSNSAQTNEPQKPFDYFKTQIQSWIMENANKLATSIDDNIVLKENDLFCDSNGRGGWFCYVSHLMGTGNHADYKIELRNSGGSSYGRDFTLYLTDLQLYDRFGDYSECEYQWKVNYPDNEASFYIFNHDTGKFLMKNIVKLPTIEFAAFKSPGKCK